MPLILVSLVEVRQFCFWFYTLHSNFYVVEPLFRSGVLKVVPRDDKEGDIATGKSFANERVFLKEPLL